MSEQKRRVHILLVEDNPADVALTLEVLRGNGIDTVVDAVSDGVEALAHLGRGVMGENPLPDLVILDLNMPRMSGLEFLTGVRKDTRFRAIPIIILSTSAAESDVVASYARGANSYVTKPLELRAYEEALHKLQSFWFSVARLPSEHGGTA